jgi:ABC-type sugar transport system permease subunit
VLSVGNGLPERGEPTTGELVVAVEVPNDQGIRRAVVGGLALTAVLVTATFIVIGPLDPRAGAASAVVERVVASLIGAGGIIAGLRAFRVTQQDLFRRSASLALSLSASLAIWWLYVDRAGVRAAIISVIVAIVASAALFVGANRWLDQVLVAWWRFTTVTGLALGALLGIILVGNRSIGLFIGVVGVRADRSLWLVPVLAVLAAAYGFLIGRTSGRLRPVSSIAGGAVLGLVVGTFLRVGALPSLEPVPLIASPLAVAAVAGVLGRLRGRDPKRAALTGASIGWLIGAFGFPELGAGTILEGIVGTAVLGALVGARLGIGPQPETSARLRLEARIRGVIFLAPALTFVGAALIIPTVRTLYLSFLDRRSNEFVGFDNFVFIFGQPSFFNIQLWRGIFSATEFVIFSFALMGAALLALRQRRDIDGVTPPRLAAASAAAALLLGGALLDRAGRLPDAIVAGWRVLAILTIVAISVVLWDYLRRNPGNSGFSGAGGGLLGTAVLFLSLAVFVHLRGTLFNNLWWVVMVTATATGLGLAIAALTDRSRGESIAKSIIFMPMALSFVGAGIIWRFMYLARPESRPQTGVLNALWVGIGNASVSDRAGLWGAVFVALALTLVLFAIAALRLGALGSGWSSVLIATWFAWIGTRFLGGGGIAGVTVVDGQAAITPLLFISGTQQVGAYNNLFIMIPFIWIYTGFAMVIFSAAIKGVPADLLEAGRVDGATDSQSFWRIVLPQISPTIGVVITTIVVVVMKVFDIVKVMTNGNFGTQVLANEMWNRAFLDGNFGVGSAVAVILFLSVLPVMFLNIRRMQKEAA